jgi:glycosyltransferase involved in cell wall biosynthesis
MFSPWYPNRLHATLGNFVHHHAKTLASKHQVTVLNIRFNRSASKAIEWEESIIDGVNVIHVYLKPGLSKAISYRNALKLAYQNLNISQSFDLIHFNILSESWPAILFLSKRCKLPLVLTEHWSGYNPERNAIPGKIKLAVLRKAASKLHTLTTVTHQLGRNMNALGLSNTYTMVPNVVNTAEFVPTNEKNDPFTFLHISGLDENKNPQGIIRAFAEMKNQHCVLMIGGDGDLAPLRKTVSDLPQNIQARIELLSAMSNTEVAKKMQKASTLVMFSSYENFPCVIAEAWACGIPAISSNVGGIQEFMNEERGILLKERTETELTHAMDAATNISWDNAQIRNYADTHFSEAAVVKQFEAVYQSVLNKH